LDKIIRGVVFLISINFLYIGILILFCTTINITTALHFWNWDCWFSCTEWFGDSCYLSTRDRRRNFRPITFY